MKKISLIFALLFGAVALNLGNHQIANAGDVQSYTSQVVVDNIEHGEIITDITEGNVGDKVTLQVSPYILYKIDSVAVNGINLTPNEEGFYEFLLVEGENKITATFSVNKEELQVIAGVLSDAKDGNWENIFNMENLLIVINWAVTLFCSSGFFLTLIKNRKIKAETVNEVKAAVLAVVNSNFGQMTKDFLEQTILPITEKYNVSIEYLDKTMKAMARCFMLAQENTPEARLSIVEELTKLNNNEKDLREEVKAIIDEEIAKNQANQDKLNQDIEALKAANEAITNRPAKEDEDYGEI
jgi:hypothetical protein